MKRSMLKVLALLAVAAMFGGLFCGCSASSAPTVAPATASAASAETAAPSAALATPQKVTITSFTSTDPDIDQLCGGDPNNEPWAKIKEAKTGIHVDYIFASPDNAADKFKLLLSSGDVPDIFGSTLDSDYAGGKAKALADGLIVSINKYLDTTCIDYKKALESNPEYMKNIQDDNGVIYGFAALRSNSSRIYGGPMIRRDLLTKAGITSLPVTIDDWYTDLKAIKTAGYTSPLTIQFWWKIDEGGFCGAYGTTGNFVIGTDDKIHLGAIEDGYRQFLTTFQKWYAEGLIDPDFFTVSDGSLVNAKLTDMKTSGAALANVSRIQISNTAGKQKDSNFDMIGTQYPVLNAGDQPLYGQQDPPVDQRWYVSAKAKDIEACMRWYDYDYTDEGVALENWGIQDKTYTVSAGKKAFTNMIPIGAEKNPDGLTLDQSLKMYIPMAVDLNGVEDGDSFIALRMTYPGQADSIKAWTNFKIAYSLPPSLSYTTAEQIVMKQQQNILDDIKSWRAKFVTGNANLSQWDAYVAEIKSLGSDDVLTVMNLAYERFKARK